MDRDGQGLRVAVELDDRFKLSAVALSTHSGHIDVGMDPFWGILLSLVANTRHGRLRLRTLYGALPVELKMTIGPRFLELYLLEPLLANRWKLRGANLRKAVLRGGEFRVEVDTDIGMMFATASVTADVGRRQLILLLGPNNIPGGVWPAIFETMYDITKVDGTKMTVDLSAFKSIAWSIHGESSELTLCFTVIQFLDFLHEH